MIVLELLSLSLTVLELLSLSLSLTQSEHRYLKLTSFVVVVRFETSGRAISFVIQSYS